MPPNDLTNFLHRKVCQTALRILVDPQALMKVVGSAGSFMEVIPNLFEVKNLRNLLQLLGHQFCHRFSPNKLNGLRPAFFGCNSIFIFGVEVKVEVKWKNPKLPLI